MKLVDLKRNSFKSSARKIDCFLLNSEVKFVSSILRDNNLALICRSVLFIYETINVVFYDLQVNFVLERLQKIDETKIVVLKDE
jgi:hypothetical protein